MAKIRKKGPNEYRTQMMGYVFPEYSDLAEYRERVDDCLQGQRTIKSKAKYLPPNQWQVEHPDEYRAYVGRALFYSLTAYAMRIYEGLTMSGSPNVILPNDKRMDFLLTNATVHGRDLHSLQANLNREQFAHGLRCMLTQVTEDEKRPFFIQEYCANSFLVAHFREIDGLSKADAVLVDLSGLKLNIKSKMFEYVPKALVLGLDKNEEYYQTVIDPFSWPEFDILFPKKVSPGDDDITYPQYRGRRLNHIPFTWCGATSLSGVSFDIPPLLDMADCEIKLFQLDAQYAQHIFQSSQETAFFLGAKKGQFDLNKVRWGSGAHNALPPDMDVKVISNNGVGFQAQKDYMDSIMNQIELRRMSIMSSKSHQSGTAVGIVQNAQTAPLRTVVNTSGDAITEQLRNIAEWMGYSKDEILKVLYVPSQDFARVESNLSEFVALCNAVAEGVVPMLESDLYRLAKENGYVTDKESWDEFKKKWKLEKLSRQENLGFIPQSGTNNLTGGK